VNIARDRLLMIVVVGADHPQHVGIREGQPPDGGQFSKDIPVL
jgi:hypothetical protein